MKFEQPARGRISMFVAAFDGECFTCGGDIFEGDEAGYLPGDSDASCGMCTSEHTERG